MPSPHRSQRLLAVTAGAILLAALVLLYRRVAPASASGEGRIYYLDLANHNLFVDEAKKDPPFRASSGGDAVRAFVFTCGDCADPAQRRVGYLQKRTPEALQLIAQGDVENLPPPQAHLVQNGWLVATHENSQVGAWRLIDSPEGQRMTQAWRETCSGHAKVCAP